MKKCIKRFIILAVIIILIPIFFISIFFVSKNCDDNKQIEYIEKIYSEDMMQNRLSDEKVENSLLSMNEEKVIGIVQIDKINFKGPVYEGTSLDTLAKGIGHFENTPYLNGNVCLAAHNTNKFWSKLNTLKIGDKITYTSFLGTKEYSVYDISQIEETDWTKLEDTDENILTLITCVKGNKPKRLCVQAIEIK